jgi:hypothetical protein
LAFITERDFSLAAVIPALPVQFSLYALSNTGIAFLLFKTPSICPCVPPPNPSVYRKLNHPNEALASQISKVLPNHFLQSFCFLYIVMQNTNGRHDCPTAFEYDKGPILQQHRSQTSQTCANEIEQEIAHTVLTDLISQVQKKSDEQNGYTDESNPVCSSHAAIYLGTVISPRKNPTRQNPGEVMCNQMQM